MRARDDIPHFFTSFPLYWIWALSRVLGALLTRQAFNVHYIMLSWLFFLLLLSPFIKQLCFDDLHVGSFDDLHVRVFGRVLYALRVLSFQKGRGVARLVVSDEHQAVIPETLDGWRLEWKTPGKLDIYLVRYADLAAALALSPRLFVLPSKKRHR